MRRAWRINLRLDPEALGMIRATASARQQDLMSFMLGAAMERARTVLAEDRILRLTRGPRDFRPRRRAG